MHCYSCLVLVLSTMSCSFRLIRTAPLSTRIRSRDCCAYLYRIIKFIGWIPPEVGTRRYPYIFWSSLISIFSTIYLPVGLVFSLIIDFKKFTPSEFLGIVQISANIIGASVKGTLLRIMLIRLDKANSMLDKLDGHVQSKQDRRRIHKAVARCNYIFLVYGIYYLVYTLIMLISGAIIGQPPWLVYNPLFDWRNGPYNLWMQSIMEYMIMFMMANSILILDTYPMMYVMIFRAHVDVLKNQIENLRRNSFQDENANYAELLNCIEYHKRILICCNILRPVISHTIFLQFLLIGSVYGITLVNLLYFSGIYRGISSIVFLFAVSLQTFPFCYLCDLLANDCEDLSNCLIHSCWIDAEPKYKKTLKIFMHHVQQQIIFIAGGIFPISMNTNIKVAKLAFSVMTIVQNMNLADRFK